MSDHIHQPTVLHQDKYGYLVYCPNCSGFQISYGTFALSQNQHDLECFADLINRYYHRYAQRTERMRRDIFLDTPYVGFGIILSAADLERLNSILQKGLLILAAQDPVSQQ
ncbi:hypothetical protein FUA23_21225 [Neolewinella aurantiaca]|uniref:Uncharacterized protein n=1 Tax=Neolewinella aurantiaca TaxID=2602767 RepID=A0A5C7FFB8_9BACT|nr:DUF6686 family protein [Neolewinella aurantiaca]TXF84383.1 hypothetical protein FUA23_21225 [Neolewinella aurantiaca]